MVYQGLDAIFQLLYLALLARVLLSWIPHNPYHPVVALLHRVTDPLLRPFQDIVPSYRFGIDLSPIFAFIALGLIRRIIFSLL